MLILAIMAVLILAAAGAWVFRCAVLRERWGREFDQELRSVVRGGSWVDATDVREALLADLMRRSDLVMARG